ncbi:MAG TPA: nitrous oxide reductase accessory protein NosL [Sulfuriferula sp.]|nr:nitrous oxide reductase accessory protein NosL [Sulfuriferula sp.]
MKVKTNSVGQLHRAAKIGLSALVVLSAVACHKADQPIQAIEPTAQTACALDGMLLLDFPGPKAQIHYADGETDFFCDTMEMFSLYLKPEQQRRVKAIFTQDMGKANWQAPRGQWIDARKAYFVIGSDMSGSMGPTLASFARMEDARAFSKTHGGKVLRFDQVTPEMTTLAGGVIHDERM